jgi:hypothetical protein
MRHACFVLCLTLGASSLCAEPCPPLPDDPHCRETWFVRNLEPVDLYPNNFRRTDDSYQHTCDGDAEPCPSRVGLDKVNASGSGQPSVGGYRWIAGSVPKPLFVFDLRQESHGFVGDLPVSWYLGRDQINCGKTDAQIATAEADLLRALDREASAAPMKLKNPADQNNQCDFADQSIEVPAAGRVESEADVIRKLSNEYRRIYVADFHPPEDAQVDAFVNVAKRLPGKAWVHFHCAAGDGRTTTFLVMYDMMQNALAVDAATIIKRQFYLGGVNLADTADTPEWKRAWAVARYKLVLLFHRYCIDQIPRGFAVSFSDWKRRPR